MTIPTVPQCASMLTGIYGSPKLEAWRVELCILQVGMALAAGVKCVFHHAAPTQKSSSRLAPESNCFGVALSCGPNPCIAGIFG